VDRPEIPHLSENDLGHLASEARPRPLAIDPWVASSLLQKAIRRGDVDLAERAAFTLSRYRGQGIWQRLIVIAFEDVGVGSVDTLLQTTRACMSAEWRLAVGGDELSLHVVVRLLAEAPKDRPPTTSSAPRTTIQVSKRTGARSERYPLPNASSW
jgi:replication-associated recombination protein RarA